MLRHLYANMGWLFLLLAYPIFPFLLLLLLLLLFLLRLFLRSFRRLLLWLTLRLIKKSNQTNFILIRQSDWKKVRSPCASADFFLGGQKHTIFLQNTKKILFFSKMSKNIHICPAKGGGARALSCSPLRPADAHATEPCHGVYLFYSIHYIV